MACVQYHGGNHEDGVGYLDYHRAYHDTCGGYHEYLGGGGGGGERFSSARGYHLLYLSTMGDITIHVGDIMIRVGDIMIHVGNIMSTVGCSLP